VLFYIIQEENIYKSGTHSYDLARVIRDEGCATMATQLRFFPNYNNRFIRPPPSSNTYRSSPTQLVIKINCQSQSSQLQAQALSKKKRRRPENVDGDLFVGSSFLLI